MHVSIIHSLSHQQQFQFVCIQIVYDLIRMKQFLTSILFVLLAVDSLSFTKQIHQLNARIEQLQAFNQVYTQQRKPLIDNFMGTPLSQNINIEYPYAVPYDKEHSCVVADLHQNQTIEVFPFQTTNHVYIAVNRISGKYQKIEIYTQKCTKIKEITNILLKQILCDRGICQSGTVYFISSTDTLHSMHEDKQFASLLNLGNLITQSRIVGGVIRHKSQQKIQIFIVEEKGIVKIYDENGQNKLSLTLESQNKNVVAFKDHHPFPIILTESNWISLLDTSKYLELSSNCPFIPQILFIFAENSYDDVIYLLTKNMIYLMDMEAHRKGCQIRKIINLNGSLPSKIQSVNFFNGALFIDNFVYNFTENSLSERKQTLIIQNSQIICHSSIFNFKSKKNQAEDITFVNNCCSEDKCAAIISQIKKKAEDKSVLLWVTIAFIFILFLSVKFMRKSSYPVLDFDQETRIKYNALQSQLNELNPKDNQKKSKKK